MIQKIYWGIDSINELLITLEQYAPRHIFLVRGKSSYELCGAKSFVDIALNTLQCEVTEFYDFEENPKIEDVERGITLLRQCKASVIVAVGGGSVIDMSKLIRFFYSYSGNPTGNVFKKQCGLLPLIALPTTSGTGSDVTHFAVLYKDKVKYSVEHDDVLPDVSIVYPPFTYKNPQYLTACTGFDALAQAIEAYWNVNATDESDIYAEKAVELLWTNLPLVVNNPTYKVRDKVSEGAYWAGRAINITKTTAPHAFSYPFTTYYGYPHGHAVALTFPFFFNYYVFSSSNRKAVVLRDKCKKDMREYLLDIGLDTKIPLNGNAENIVDKCNFDRMKNFPLKINRTDLINYLNGLSL